MFQLSAFQRNAYEIGDARPAGGYGFAGAMPYVPVWDRPKPQPVRVERKTVRQYAKKKQKRKDLEQRLAWVADIAEMQRLEQQIAAIDTEIADLVAREQRLRKRRIQWEDELILLLMH